jgi:Holliday junction resolvase RusA-like endonuclease
MTRDRPAAAGPSRLLVLFIPGQSQPQGSSRAFVVAGKARVTSANKQLKAWREKAVVVIRQEMNLCGRDRPFTAPVRVTIGDLRLAPKRRSGRVHPCVRPDLDKIIRAVLDALTDAQAIADDCLVCEIEAWKDYSSDAGVYVKVQEIGE